MTSYHLIFRPEVREQMNKLSAAAATDQDGREAKEYAAVKLALLALRDGREQDYQGKRLGYGRDSHDLSDCAELKVPVVERRDHPGPSHRLIYREFDNPFPEVVDGRVVRDENAKPFREIVAFEYRGNEPDPAAVAGQRLQRTRGLPETGLQGLGGGKPDIGPQRGDAPVTPHRIPLPPDLMKAAAMLHGSAPASGAVQAPNAAGDTAARRTTDGGRGPVKEV